MLIYTVRVFTHCQNQRILTDVTLFRSGAYFWRNYATFGQGNGDMYYSHFNCGGGEDAISQCMQSPLSCSDTYGITIACNAGEPSLPS